MNTTRQLLSVALGPTLSTTPLPAGTVAGPKGGRILTEVRLTLTAKDDALVSATPLPEGKGYRIVVQVRANDSARPTNYRVDFHDEVCGGCDRAEYACLCESHGGGQEHGH